MVSVEFWITALIVVIAPGAGVIYTLAAGLGQGRLASVFAAFGCTLGILPHIAASLLGVAALLHTSAMLFQMFKFAGVAYLIYLAVQTLRDSGPLRFDADRQPRPLTTVMRNGFLINILNPKLSIFFLAFLPQFVPANSVNALGQMMVLAAIFMAMTFVVFVIYGQFAGMIRDRFLSSARAMTWLRRVIAGTMGGLALRLALTND